jgi:hypothetical protein
MTQQPMLVSGFRRVFLGSVVTAAVVLAGSVGAAWMSAQAPATGMDLVVSRNVNMVSGQTLPNGDPYLQRQNEPSVAASTRNPLHLLAGANDYRTVDIPGSFEDGETGDAWLGVFKSFDGGERWQSSLLPGYPQDTSAEGMASPLKAYRAGADPVVRPGTNGLIYYSGLVFNRGEGAPSAIFVSRFVDNNNKENGDPIAYLSTSIVASSTGASFLDKPWMAVDVPRAGARVCKISNVQPAPVVSPAKTTGRRSAGAGRKVEPKKPQPPRTINQQILAGTMYVAYASITTSTTAAGVSDVASQIMFSRSEDCGETWSKPQQISRPEDKVNQGATIAIDPRNGAVHVAWRQFGLTETAPDAMMITSSAGAGKAFDKPRRVHQFPTGRRADQLLPKLKRSHRMGDVHELVAIKPFDSGTAEDRFRTNAYPTMAIDDESRIYLAWTERGFGAARPDALTGDARIVLATSRAGGAWTTPRPVDTGAVGNDLPGHQMMPSMTYAGGRLVIAYYDLRQDVSNVFGAFVDENDAIYTSNKRHTIDLRAVQASKGDVPVFGASTLISQYLMGNLRGSTQVGQLQYNAPNLPLFQLGSVPFMGDYIDIAPAPAFVQSATGQWTFNTVPTTAPVFHAVWTDNRDVQKPRNGDWKNYTPPGVATCLPGQTGMRNQNIYSARVTMGLVTGSPGNAKPLDPSVPRAFVVFAQNTTYVTKSFRLTIAAQPVGGQASFDQLGLTAGAALLTSVDVMVAPRSMVTRTVFATSSDPKNKVTVDVAEITAPRAAMVLQGGLASRVILNPDISNPDISNPDISNPDISNPDISNAEVYNPDISNPDISNPDISNPDISNPDISNPDISNILIANPDISNPDISNPDISNPDISNPDISNPDISNPDISNGSLTDVTWTITNTGNTTAAFNVTLFLARQAAAAGGIKTQLVVHKTYKTPVSNGCTLGTSTQTVLVANVLNPTFKTAGESTVFDPSNPDISNTTLWLEPGGTGLITLRIVDPNPRDNITINPVTDVTPVVTADPINTTDLGTPTSVPPTTTPPPASLAPVALAFVSQPSAATANTAMAPITVSAFSGAVPQADVQVTLAIAVNPAAGHLTGTVTVLTNVSGLATFSGLSIERDGTPYQLSASASASGALPVLSAPFTVGAVAPPPASAWSATGDGIVALLDNGAVGGTPRMSYQRNGFPNFTGAWTLSTVAAVAGAVRLDWEWAGLHSYCASAVQLQSFVNRGGLDVFVGPLLQMSDSCVGAQNPSAGFAFAGVTSVAVQAGDTYGFRLNGSHGDGSYLLEGTFGAVVNGATSASPFVVTNASDGGPGSLRAALIAANAAPDADTITFAIPGPWVHTIAPATPLPVVTNPVIIDGLSQPGSASMAPMINIDGRTLKGQLSIPYPLLGGPQGGTSVNPAAGFEVASSSVTIRGLGINRFPGPGVYVGSGQSHVHVEDNAIGAGRAGVQTWPANNMGVWADYGSNHVIARNVISSSEGAGILLVGGSGTSITGNRIGTSADGLTALPNLDNGITIYDGTSGTIIDGNLISGNGTIGAANGFGIDIQQSGALPDVTDTVITNNVIGLDAAGNLLARQAGDYVGPGPGFPNFGPVQRGNVGGGIRLNRASNTIIGGIGVGNTISGNSNAGVYITGPMAIAPLVIGNRIGTNAAGTQARSNTGRGVAVVNSTAFIGLPGVGNRNVISGNIQDGVYANGNTVIENNFIGLDVTGTVAIGNGELGDGGTPFSPGCCHTGVFVESPNNYVRNNVVSGQSANLQNPGIRSDGAVGQTRNYIEDNKVGTDVTGLIAIGNGIGIGLYGDQSGTIVRRNLIAHNAIAGVWLVEGTAGAVIGGVNAADGNVIRNNNGHGIMVGYNAGTSESINSILSNLMFGNNWGSIDLGNNGPTANDAGDGDSGPNGFQNYPVLSNPSNAGASTTVDFTLDSLQINANHRIQVFASPSCHVSGFGEGERLVGSFLQMSDGAGDMAVVGAALTELVPVGQFLTATATDGNGNTSEFSQCVQVTAASSAIITSASPANGTPGEGFMVFRGTNLPATILDVIAEVVSGATTYSGFWFGGPSTATAGYVRMPFGVPLGPATLRLRNTAGTVVSNAFPITITAVPGTPVINLITDAADNTLVAPAAAGSTIRVQSDGIDTTGAVVRFVQGAYTVDVGVAGVVSGFPIGMAAQVAVPGDVMTGPVSVSIRQGAGAFSAPVVISVSNPGFIGTAGGPGGNPFGPVTCNPGSVLTALTGEAGSYVGQFTMWCAPVLPGPTLGAAVASAVIGIPGVGPTNYGAALTCPANSVITGISGLAGNVGWGTVVASLGVRCTDVTTNAVVTKGPIGGGAPTPYSFMCPAGDEGIGFAGGFGGVLDRIGIVCGDPVTLPPGGVITSITPSSQVAAGFGQLVHIRGNGMLGTGVNDVLFSNGGPEFPAQYVWSAGPNLVVARLPTGVLATGAASVRVRNPGQTLATAAYAFTLSNTPGAPVVNTVQSGCGTGSAINATTVGATISFHSEGVDTSGATISWIGPGGTFNQSPTSTGGGISGSVMVCATVPAMSPGAYTVSITTTVSGQTSAASNAFVISVS